MSIRSGTSDWAKYPFLNDASEYIRQIHIDLEEFNRPEMKHVIDRAVERIEIEMSGKLYESLTEYDEEILTFLITLILIKSIGVEYIVKKYSLLEAMRAERFLSRDLNNVLPSTQEKHAILFKIFGDLFKVKVGIENVEGLQLFKIKVTDYLMRASYFPEQEWRLINRLVDKGHVYLDAETIARLIRSELSALIHNRVKTMQLPSLPEIIKNKADELRVKYSQRYEYRANTVTAYPPCIKHALEVMGRGDNLPHAARVMLATYMLMIGKSIDEIVILFQTAPDFNERITRYQIEHLGGLRGSHTKYSVPSCEKLNSENLCYATKECEGIINPIQFGRRIRKDVGNE